LIKRFHKQQDTRKQYKINERIWAAQLRVLDSEGKQIGILSRDEALAKARELEMDLVEIAAMAQPPVAKIIDFKKFLYQESKKKQEEKRKVKVSETKEVRLGPHMSDNDLQVMVERARGFLEGGDKVRLVLKFKGRQIIHPEFGHGVMKKVTDALHDCSKIDKAATLMGKQLMMVISPDKKGKHAKEEN
jgi:translation initiation factor IF-3